MSSIFIGKSGLKLRYSKLTFTQLASANSAASAVQLASLMGAAHIAYFDNSLSTECAILACHPDNDPSVAANRFLMFEMDAGQIINFGENFGTIEFDAGAFLFAYYVGSSAPTSGKIKLVWF